MCQPKQKAQTFAEGRRVLDEWVPSDPRRPIYTAIRSKFIERLAEYHGLLTQEVSERSRGNAPAARQRLDLLEKESMQLAGLLFSRSNLWAARDWRKPAIIKFLVRALRHSRGGRPMTKLHVAVLAKEMKLADAKRWTWSKITAELCDCGDEHTIRCQDNLRREVIHLEKMIRKLGCTISA